MSLLSPEQLLLIHQRAYKCRQGPWRRYGYAIRQGAETSVLSGPLIASVEGPSPEYIHEGEFIAHAREDIPALLDHIQTLERMLADADDTNVGFQRGYLEGQRVAIQRCGQKAEYHAADGWSAQVVAEEIGGMIPAPYEDKRDEQA